MLVLITLFFQKDKIEQNISRIETLILNFIKVGFINIENRQDKLVFKGFIETEYDLYFYSLLKFLFAYDEKNKRNGYCDILAQAKIVVKKKGKLYMTQHYILFIGNGEILNTLNCYKIVYQMKNTKRIVNIANNYTNM